MFYSNLRQEFKGYLKRFKNEDGRFSDPIKIKIGHTLRVVREIEDLAAGNNPLDIDTAKCAALLHDIGRFQQYATFGTYDDRVSINHAALSLVVIDQLGLLSEVGQERQRLIRTAIQQHNNEKVSANLNPHERALSLMLRDADKLDIWRVIIEQDRENPIEDNYSEENFERIKQIKGVPYALAKTRADIRLFRLGWMFDVHCPQAIAKILSRHYLDDMFSKLPHTERFSELYLVVKEHLEDQLNNPTAQKNQITLSSSFPVLRNG